MGIESTKTTRADHLILEKIHEYNCDFELHDLLNFLSKIISDKDVMKILSEKHIKLY